MKPYKYIDLFPGAGELGLGFGDAGFDLKLANNISSDEIETFGENLNITHSGTNKENVDCGDFPSWLYAQDFYEAAGMNNVHGLD